KALPMMNHGSFPDAMKYPSAVSARFRDAIRPTATTISSEATTISRSRAFMGGSVAVGRTDNVGGGRVILAEDGAGQFIMVAESPRVGDLGVVERTIPSVHLLERMTHPGRERRFDAVDLQHRVRAGEWDRFARTKHEPHAIGECPGNDLPRFNGL